MRVFGLCLNIQWDTGIYIDIKHLEANTYKSKNLGNGALVLEIEFYGLSGNACIDYWQLWASAYP